MSQTAEQPQSQSLTPSQSLNSSLLTSVAKYLQHLNQRILPTVAATGSIPNAINAREGLAALTYGYVTQPMPVAWVSDDVIAASDAMSPDVHAQLLAALCVDQQAAPLQTQLQTQIQDQTGWVHCLPQYDVPVRIYHPDPDTALPCLLYLHGGGGTAGSVSVYDGILRRIAHHTRHIVVAPEYRLAPENPFPAGQMDAVTALLGVRDLLSRRGLAFTGRLVMAGDSHGGALLSNLWRAELDDWVGAGQVAAQVLIYPSVDFTLSQPSIDTYGEGYLLSKARIEWYFNQYFQHSEDRQAQSSLYQRISSSTPPALIVNAAIDPLADEGSAYANKLRQVGVPVQHQVVDGVIHAFMNMEDLHPQVCEQVYQRMAEFLR